MKSRILPDYREKQQILYIAKKSPKDLIAYGDHYLKKGQIPDALEFYQHASYEEGIEKIRELAEEKGDTMIFQQAMRAFNRKISPDQWDRIGSRALENGKMLFALHAFTSSGNEEMRSKTQKLISEDKSELKT